MKFVSDSGREFDNYEEAKQNEYEYYNTHINTDDIIKNIIFYDEYGNIISIDTNDFVGSFSSVYYESHFMKIKDDINEDTIPNINRYYDFYLFLPLKPGMYRYDADYDEWRSFSTDKDAWEKWKKLMDKGLV